MKNVPEILHVRTRNVKILVLVLVDPPRLVWLLSMLLSANVRWVILVTPLLDVLLYHLVRVALFYFSCLFKYLLSFLFSSSNTLFSSSSHRKAERTLQSFAMWR